MSENTLMLKISGEQIGTDTTPFNMSAAGRITDVIRALREEDHDVACVVGGGNVMRGPSLIGNGFSNQVVADHIGMLVTIQNALFFNEAVANPNIKVMDKTAMALAADKCIQIAIGQPIPEHVISMTNVSTRFGSIIE